MDIAPPPTGTRIRDLGNRLVVQFRPKRSWGVLLFFAAWLAFWTFAGISALAALLNAGWSEALFLLLWLCFWATFEVVVVVAIAWQLFGRELLVVTAEQLEVRKEIGRFARTKSYDVALVRDLKATRVPIAEEEQPRKDFCLEFTYHDKPVRIGEGMGEREAEDIAATVSARIQLRRTWWGEESGVQPQEPPPEVAAPAAPRRRRLGILAQIAFPLLVLAAIASLVVVGRRDSDQGSPPQPPPSDVSARGPRGPQDPYAVRRALASARTFYALTSAKTTVLTQPICRPRPTWSRWTCTVTAWTTLPPLAGRTLHYRCSAVSTPQPGVGSAVVLCGPDPPRRLGG